MPLFQDTRHSGERDRLTGEKITLLPTRGGFAKRTLFPESVRGEEGLCFGEFQDSLVASFWLRLHAIFRCMGREEGGCGGRSENK